MVVPNGYKETEIGCIPLEWHISQLEQIANIRTGPFGSALHADDYVFSGTPIITVEHLGESSITKNDLPLVSDFDKKRLDKYTLNTGDIVFSRVGSIDRNAYVTENESGWLFSGRLLRIRSISDSVNSKYLSFYFKLRATISRIESISVGQTMASLNTQLMNKFNVVLPAISEQRSIASALSEMDELIVSLENLIEKKKVIKQGAMQELLTGKKRLPGFEGEWTEYSLNQLEYEQPTMYIVKSDHYFESGIPVLTAGKTILLGYTHECDGIYEKGDVIIFDDFTTASKYITYKFKVKSSAMKLLTSRESNINLKFIFETMQLIDFKLNDHQRYWISEYSKIRVLFPPTLEEQNAITDIISDMDGEIETLTQKLEKYRQIKQGMMQELLTGRIRLVDTASKK